MYIDNSAQTLHNFLMKIRKQPNSHRLTKEGMYSVFEIEDSEDKDVLLWDKMSKLMSLPKKVEDTITEHFPEDVLPVPNWKPCMNKFFSSLSLHESLSTTQSRIDSAALNDLGMLSILFKTKGQIGQIKDEQIEEITQQLLDLKKSVLESDFSIALKKDILHYINNLIRAFEDYEITGIEPIISATEATMGHACMSPSFNDVVTQTETGSKLKNIIKTTLSSINSVEGIVSLGANGVALLQFFNSSNDQSILGLVNAENQSKSVSQGAYPTKCTLYKLTLTVVVHQKVRPLINECITKFLFAIHHCCPTRQRIQFPALGSNTFLSQNETNFWYALAFCFGHPG